MTDLMNCEKQILVRSSPNYIRGQEKGPREEWRVSKEVGGGYLERYNAQNDIFRPRLWPTELRDFGMGFYDGLSARTVRLFGICPEEIMFFGLYGWATVS